MDIEQEILDIKQRNSRVELDKKWELSWTRRIFIAATTYVIAGTWLSLARLADPWLSAFVPVVGYVLSTLSLPAIKKRWAKSVQK